MQLPPDDHADAALNGIGAASVEGAMLDEHEPTTAEQMPDGFRLMRSDELDPQQAQAVRLLASGERQVDVAKEVGVTVRTIQRWRERPVFRLALATAMDEVHADYMATLHRLSVQAMSTLMDELCNPDNDRRGELAVKVLAMVERNHPKAVDRAASRERWDAERELRASGFDPTEARPADDEFYEFVRDDDIDAPPQDAATGVTVDPQDKPVE